MATAFKSIPLIDISPLLAKWNDPKTWLRTKVLPKSLDNLIRPVEKLDSFTWETYEAVCNTYECSDSTLLDNAIEGFKGHGIPDSLVKEVRSMAHKFFDLPYEEKTKIKLSATTGYRGYQRVGENITKGIPDMHEAIDCLREVKQGMYGAFSNPLEGCNEWPPNPPNFRHLMELYISLCTDLSRKIMRGIALALGGPVDVLEGKRAGDPFWALRIIGYPGLSCGQDMSNSDIGCGVHTDYGLLTLVNQDDDITALQVRNLSGEWISAVPIPGTFVCNIGDMLKILSNGHYESTLHRVINKSPKFRVCVAYFYEPNFNAAIEPLDACIENSGGTKKFEAAVYGEHLIGKILTNFVHQSESWLLIYEICCGYQQ